MALGWPQWHHILKFCENQLAGSKVEMGDMHTNKTAILQAFPFKKIEK
jgi:hypothetical protein